MNSALWVLIWIAAPADTTHWEKTELALNVSGPYVTEVECDEQKPRFWKAAENGFGLASPLKVMACRKIEAVPQWVLALEHLDWDNE
jgi:hypothetical protein